MSEFALRRGFRPPAATERYCLEAAEQQLTPARAATNGADCWPGLTPRWAIADEMVLPKSSFLEYLAHVGAEPGDVAAQILCDVGRVG